MLVCLPIICLLLSQALWFIFGKPRFITEITSPEKSPKVSLIIPARDEEENLPRLLESIQTSTTQPYEVLVIDDGSTDDTAKIANAAGATVIQPAPLPDDWKGKPWACQEGAQQATGDWLFFLDADVWFEKDGLEKVFSLAQDLDHVSSICPYHHIESPAEELSSFFNLIMAAGVNAFDFPTSTQSSPALFGQSLFISKKIYQEGEGHQHVKGEILENFHLAEHLEKRGIIRHCYLGRGTLSMQMFKKGLPELWQSWKKGFTSGAKQASPRALLLISLWLTAGMTIITALALLVLPSSGGTLFTSLTILSYLFFATQCLWSFRKVGNFSPLNALFFPITLLFYQILFFTALIEKKRGVTTNWKGRDVS